MDIKDVSSLNGGYTHIHFAFANLTEDFVPSGMFNPSGSGILTMRKRYIRAMRLSSLCLGSSFVIIIFGCTTMLTKAIK